jgi:hypothetical protein
MVAARGTEVNQVKAKPRGLAALLTVVRIAGIKKPAKKRVFEEGSRME